LLIRGSTTFVEAGKNFNYDIRTNGETRLLRSLSAFDVSVVFDVGANYGEWSTVALAALPTSTVHAFEIIPQVFTGLHTVMAAEPRMVLNNIGLSDVQGPATVNYSPEHEGASSIVAVREIHDIRWDDVKSETTTGDAYCSSAGIHHIDFLKIDVEGAEGLVLRGFSGMLSRRAIDVVQFEYGMAAIYSRFLLRDFYELFEKCGYLVGKLMPHGVRFRAYNPIDEDFRGPNFVAVSSDRKDIVAAVTEPSRRGLFR
jgi:FkbM family methyltransferase